MNLKSLNLKLIIAIVYLTIIAIGIFFLLSNIDIRDLMSYDFIRSNKDIILEYKRNNFLVLTVIFFVFSIIWVFLLGFAMPLLVFSGFVFGTWWGISIVLISTTIGATLLYLLVGLFFREIIEEKLAPKFSKLKNFFNKNDITYFMFFRFIGGGGTPYAVQNVLPVLFNMPVKNYFVATLIGSMPSMFVTVALGSGLESVIDKNEEPSFFQVLFSPEVYLPIAGFAIILVISFFAKRFFFKI
tara:strand:- start:4208 stop:4933 length:726 start_codon:yes stop_codon:yes gene_type:complete